MKTLFFVLFYLFIICFDFITNENICEIIKNNESFTGVKINHKWIDNNIFSTDSKNYMYSNGNEWEYEITLRSNGFKSYEIIFKENTVQRIDRKIINRFSASHTDFYFFTEFYNCDVFYKVIIFYFLI